MWISLGLQVYWGSCGGSALEIWLMQGSDPHPPKPPTNCPHCWDGSRKIRAAKTLLVFMSSFVWVCTHHAPFTHWWSRFIPFFLPGPIHQVLTSALCLSPMTQPMLSLTPAPASSPTGLGLLLCWPVLLIHHVLALAPLVGPPLAGLTVLLWVSTAPRVIPTVTLMTLWWLHTSPTRLHTHEGCFLTGNPPHPQA